MISIDRSVFGDAGVDDFVTAFLRGLANPLINAELSPRPEDSSPTWIARRHGEIVGTATPTLRSDELFGSSLWLNPGGMCATDPEVITALYSAVATHGLDDGISANYVWVPAGTPLMNVWAELGFAMMHQRGSQRLTAPESRTVPDGFDIVPGGMDFLEESLRLDDVLYEAQFEGPSFQREMPKDEQRADWIDALEDPDVTHLVVRNGGDVVGQAMIYTLPEQIGSHVNSAHLSAVSFLPEHRNRGLGVALTNELKFLAIERGFEYLETNWRTTNRFAAQYWPRRGFTPTWQRLVRLLRSY